MDTKIAFEKIQRIVRLLRDAGELDQAIDLCVQSSEDYKESSFSAIFPIMTGDLYMQKMEFDLASNYYISFLKKIKKNKKIFSRFAKRYYRLKRIWSKEKISRFAYKLLNELQEDNIDSEILNWCKELIKDDLNQIINISEEGRKICDLIKDDSQFNKFVQYARRMEKENHVELKHFLDKKILNRNRDIRKFRIDAHCISIYERLERNHDALKIATEILSIKTESVVVRSIFRICRKIKDYTIAENVISTYPEILKKSDFNIQYELVYYFEAQDQIEEVYGILLQTEKSNIHSITIQKTVRNFYLTFGFIDEADRTEIRISELSSAGKKVSGRFYTEFKESEAEVGSKIKELYSELEHQKQLAAISDLTTGISHELGQPITNIRYTVQFYYKMFQKKFSKNAMFEVFDSILEETNRMGGLIKRLSPLTSSKNVTMKFDIVGRIAKRIESESKRIDKKYIEFKISPKKEIFIEGDPVHFDQIISNLLLNAIDSIKQDKKRNGNLIQIVVNEKKDDVNIIFSDTGVGITAKNRGKIYDPFFTTKPLGKGEGLGLFIIWNLMKMQGGKIYLDHTYTDGARFFMRMPKKPMYINKKETC